MTARPEGEAVGAVLLLSLKHTRRGNRCVTFWRPDSCGYTWAVEEAGRYTAADLAADHHLDDGTDTVAVPAGAVEFLALPTKQDGRTVLAVRNTAPNRHSLLHLAAVARERRTPDPAR